MSLTNSPVGLSARFTVPHFEQQISHRTMRQQSSYYEDSRGRAQVNSSPKRWELESGNNRKYIGQIRNRTSSGVEGVSKIGDPNNERIAPGVDITQAWTSTVSCTVLSQARSTLAQPLHLDCPMKDDLKQFNSRTSCLAYSIPSPLPPFLDNVILDLVATTW